MMSFLKQPLDEATNFEADLLALQNFADTVEAFDGESRNNLATQNTTHNLLKVCLCRFLNSRWCFVLSLRKKSKPL